jgi:hypothetical protein
MPCFFPSTIDQCCEWRHDDGTRGFWRLGPKMADATFEIGDLGLGKHTTENAAATAIAAGITALVRACLGEVLDTLFGRDGMATCPSPSAIQGIFHPHSTNFVLASTVSSSTPRKFQLQTTTKLGTNLPQHSSHHPSPLGPRLHAPSNTSPTPLKLFVCKANLPQHQLQTLLNLPSSSTLPRQPPNLLSMANSPTLQPQAVPLQHH